MAQWFDMAQWHDMVRYGTQWLGQIARGMNWDERIGSPGDVGQVEFRLGDGVHSRSGSFV